MLSQTLTFAFLASTALAIPQVGISGIPSYGEPMGIDATGGPLHHVDLRAREGRIWIGGPQDTKCEDNQLQQLATFEWYSDCTVFLYTNSNPVQQMWTDASGMGQGITGYRTNKTDGTVDNAPTNASYEPYNVDQTTGVFSFVGSKSKACPTEDEGVYTLWFTNLDKPGWQSDCFEVELTAYKAPHRVACEYSEYSPDSHM